MIRELTAEEGESLLRSMVKMDAFRDFIESHENATFNLITCECPVRHVVKESNDFLTVLLFWDGGNHIVNVFHYDKTMDVWRMACDQECN